MAQSYWMDTINSGINILDISAAGGSRFWFVTAISQHDFAAGSQVSFQINMGTTGLTPPGVPTSVTVEVYPDGTGSAGTGTVTTIAGSTGSSFVASFYLTNNGTSGGTPACGIFRINLWAQNTGVGAYSVDSDGARNTGGNTRTGAPGIVRSNTTLAVAVSNTSGGTKPSLFGYGDQYWRQVTLGVAPITSESVTIANGPIASDSPSVSAAVNNTQNGICDNRFPKSLTSASAITVTPNNATMTNNGAAVAWLSPTTTTNDTASFDPRITCTHLMQRNDNTFGTPPLSKDIGTQRLASDLTFLDTRFVNANGAGINSITYTRNLQDAGGLTAAQTTTGIVTQNEGGQGGWGNNLSAWSSNLPTGNWTKTVTITAPSNATGLEVNNVETLKLVASNPNYRIITAGGPATVSADARHFVPGDTFLAGVSVINVLTMTTMALDASPAPAVAIARFNLSLGRAEYLASDGVTWTPATGNTIYFWPCTVSPGDANTYTVTFNNTSGWGNADIFIVGSAYIGGVPVNDFYKEIVVNGINNHDKYKFDGPGFVGFPTR